jgi:hypothetical protein
MITERWLKSERLGAKFQELHTASIPVVAGVYYSNNVADFHNSHHRDLTLPVRPEVVVVGIFVMCRITHTPARCRVMDGEFRQLTMVDDYCILILYGQMRHRPY